MRHRVAFKKLNRTMEHRKALRRNMAQSLFEHGQIRTTLQKAKDLQPFAERMITLAKKARQGDLQSRRRLRKLLLERHFIPTEHQEDYDNMSLARRRATRQSRSGRRHRTGQPKGTLPFTAQAVSHRLIHDIAERFEDRPGGYTRIIRLSTVRIGDAGAQAILQLLGEEETPSNVPKPAPSSRRRKADARYAAVMKGQKSAAKSRKDEQAEASAEQPDAAAQAEGGSAADAQEASDSQQSERPDEQA